jgi:hypothetical protein
MSALAAAAHQLPPDLTRGTAWEAARDADRVARFLAALGLEGRPGRPLPVPTGVLLALGAGVRLLAWESQGLTLHRDAGLPSALDVLRNAILALRTPGRLDPELPAAVLRLWAENFYWLGAEEFGADVLIDALDTGEGVAALAELLWAASGRAVTDRPDDQSEG